MATLSQPKLNVQRSNVSEYSELDGSSLGSKTGEWYNQRAGYNSDGGWKEWDNREADVDLKPEEMDDDTLLELELHPIGSLESHLEEEEDDARTEIEISSSMPSLSVLKHIPHHRAYWVEQQNRLPLPLKELMENEALEILTKALKSEPSSHKRPRGISQGLGPWDWGFRMCLSCQILLPPTNIPGVPQKNEKFGTRCKETQSGDHGVTARRPGSSLSAAPL
ncbi:cation channel sperm-associated protein subunit zeta isoform X2 [Rousettus aegyptiacus]|nr:cation channel sperm-associated protein subunit zeta isoform X2 [Rousettus aegyptiacus]